jgi:hypothetical protein
MSNTLTNILPTILAMGEVALRQRAVMAQLVNRDFQSIAQQKGNVINVPVPSAIAARAVTPAVTHAANVDFSPTTAAVTLDQWYEAPIQVSDADSASIDMAYLAMQSTEAIKSLANNVDSYIMGKHTKIFGYSGAAGTTPFNASLNVAASAALVLNANLAPTEDRRAVIGPLAEFYFKLNSNLIQADQRGNTTGLTEGVIGRVLGFDWFMDQNMASVTHTPGGGWVTGFSVSTTTGVAGGSTLHVLNATASGTIKVGDVFTLGTDVTNQYVVTASATASSTVGIDLSISPPLRAAASLGTTLAVVGTAYTVNLAFHRDSWAFASRPLSGVFAAGNVFQAPTDPISGIALRLELSRQYKQETLSYDILYGSNVYRPELASKIFG